jgi:hypothetical protein
MLQLADRGLDRDVLVVAIGEFGRTPRVNRNAGRDHWGTRMSVLIAGGGLRRGQAIGASSCKGEVPVDRPDRPENVLAMIDRHLGIDPSITFNAFAGRPPHPSLSQWERGGGEGGRGLSKSSSSSRTPPNDAQPARAARRLGRNVSRETKRKRGKFFSARVAPGAGRFAGFSTRRSGQWRRHDEKR